MLRLFCVFVLAFGVAGAATGEMPRIVASEPAVPPSWALLERRLIRAMNEAACEFVQKYADRGGRMPAIGKPDDMYEVFANWPLFYALGGGEHILDLSLRQWNAITRQLEQLGRAEREFVTGYDWFHHAEGYKYFYYLGLAAPTLNENVHRAKRFAAMYTGEDPDARNYDRERRIMRSPLTGATGPVFEQDAVYLLNHGHASLYPFIKSEIRPGWEKDPAHRDRIQRLYNRIVVRGDTPVSLSSTALVAVAYLYTGDAKYRTWIAEYVRAWIERARRNGGTIPDNIGPSGEIGGLRGGQWWGGLFGWNARYSLHMILGAVTAASEVACLVTRDPSYLDLLRSQLDMLLSRSRTVGGNLLIPYRYGTQGWFDYRPLEIREASHLWNASMDTADWSRIERMLAGYRHGPRPYDGYNDYAMPVTGHRTYRWESNGVPMDWTAVVANGDIGDKMQEQEELNEAPRLMYLAGRNPDFPERILQANHREVLRRMQVSRAVKDLHTLPDLHSEYLAGINPVVTQGLVYLTMGGPQATYNSGLLQVRLRYFDPDRKRPGLPEDVAALVEKIEADRIVLNLVNLNAFAPREVIVQAGAFGEHEFTTVRPGGRAQEAPLGVAGRHFAVRLLPSAGIRLEIGMRRYANNPAYSCL